MANASLTDPLEGPAAATSALVLQRACLTGNACTGAGQGAQTQATLAQPQNVASRDRRKRLCNRRPPDPACTNDGHSARAVQVEQLLYAYDPDRKTLIHGIFVDKDIPGDWGAYRKDCNAFVPPLDGAQSCIFVPEDFEKEAAQFNTSQAPTIGGQARDEWQRLRLRMLMHETGHARFTSLMPGPASAGACQPDDIRSELQEIAADMDEARTLDDLLRRSTLTRQARDNEFEKVLRDRWAKRAIDNWTKIQCVCECRDADSYIVRTADTMTVDWDIDLKIRYHSAIRATDPTWPIDPKPFGPGDFPAPRGRTRPA
jgi:hypothetical protein